MYNLRDITKKLQDKIYYEQFHNNCIQLVKTLGPNGFKGSCGCNEFSNRLTYIESCIKKVSKFQKFIPLLKNLDGLIFKLEYGICSDVNLNITGYNPVIIHNKKDVQYSIFLPDKDNNLRIGGIPTNIIIYRMKSDGAVSTSGDHKEIFDKRTSVYKNKFWIQFKSDNAFISISKYIGRLSKYEDTYFSFLPKELINIIRFKYLMNYEK